MTDDAAGGNCDGGGGVDGGGDDDRRECAGCSRVVIPVAVPSGVSDVDEEPGWKLTCPCCPFVFEFVAERQLGDVDTWYGDSEEDSEL